MRRSAIAAETLKRQATALDTAARNLLARDARMLAAGSGRLRPYILTTGRARAAATLAGQARLLDTLSPLNVLQRGYAVVRAADGTLVKTAKEARRYPALEIQFVDERVEVTVARQGKLL